MDDVDSLHQLAFHGKCAFLDAWSFDMNTWFFSQSTHVPLAHVGWAIDATYISLLDPWLANDIDSKSFRGSYVSSGIFILWWGSEARKRYDGRRTGHLIKKTKWSEIFNSFFRYRRNKSNGTRNNARYKGRVQLAWIFCRCIDGLPSCFLAFSPSSTVGSCFDPLSVCPLWMWGFDVIEPSGIGNEWRQIWGRRTLRWRTTLTNGNRRR